MEDKAAGKKWLIIDDFRTSGCELVARTATEGKRMLQENADEIECLCIDHDLGEKETGYDVIVWAEANGFLPGQVQIVSMNPVGAKRIASILEKAGFVLQGNIYYRKESELDRKLPSWCEHDKDFIPQDCKEGS